MSRLLKWDGTEMDFFSDLTLRTARIVFSTWTNHIAVRQPDFLVEPAWKPTVQCAGSDWLHTRPESSPRSGQRHTDSGI